MFSQIMVPVDLVHREALGKALDLATDMAKRYSADVHLVSVSGELPSELAHSAAEHGEKLDAFAGRLADKTGLTVTAHNLSSHDVEAEMDSALMKAVDQTGADLVVMASHVPGLMEYIFASHGGHMAAHAKVSVFVVR